MRMGGTCGTRVHAPEASRVAYLGAYTAGADFLHVPVRLTGDGQVVVTADPTTDRLTGKPGVVGSMTLAELRGLDFGARYAEADGTPFRYPARIETFAMLLDILPPAPLLVELQVDSERRTELLERIVAALWRRGRLPEAILCSDDDEMVRLARGLAPRANVALRGENGSPFALLDRAVGLGLDGVVVPLSTVVGPGAELTEPSRLIAQLHREGRWKLGAIALAPGDVPAAAIVTLGACEWAWGLAADAPLALASVQRPGWSWIDEDFGGEAAARADVNADLWHLGYAKNSPYCHVYVDHGVHVDILAYDGPVEAVPTGDPVRDALERLTARSWDALRDWPFYAGGGVGFGLGIDGDFAAEVDVESASAAQATTLEMAALNVDPAAHRRPWLPDGSPNRTTSFRDKHSFFDAHGAPPYVGVEHDEDDGYRINWNLGTDYDSNQYGRAVGDGKLLRARLRLERRGPFFAAYVRAPGKERPADWVCVGAVRNDSLNARVYLRCVGKRWRQENPARPSEWLPVIPNHFVFRHMTITRFT